MIERKADQLQTENCATVYQTTITYNQISEEYEWKIECVNEREYKNRRKKNFKNIFLDEIEGEKEKEKEMHGQFANKQLN